jgi:chromosome segregation protein
MASAEKNGVPRLKQLELQGYKTFASKNVFEFAPTITAIVGPNGSGKSNIADAIRWVLGEQSYSLLRGKKTEDMIFSGSETRSRAGMAAATIIFDNEEGWLPIEFTEVTVGRRAYRDSVNEYYLNNQKVRLRDVTELLAQCGLSQRTYTIIGQGLVDAALSLNPEERRRLFEEAAGISLYRSRKEEALRRLDSTRRNLERVQDILAELRPRLRSLERQAKRAIDFLQVKDDLNAVLRIWYGYHWYHLQDQVTEVIVSADDRRNARDRLRQAQQKAENDLQQVRSRITTLRGEVQSQKQEISDLHHQREGVERALAVASERMRWLTVQEALLNAEIASTENRRDSLAQRLEKERSEAKDRNKELVEAENTIRLLKSDELHSDQSDQKETPTDLGEIREELAEVIAEGARCVAQKEQFTLRQDVLRGEIQAQEKSLASNSAELNRLIDDEVRVADLIQQGEHEREEVGNRKIELERQVRDFQTRHERVSAELMELKLREAALEARMELTLATQKGLEDTIELIQSGTDDGSIDGFISVMEDRIRVRGMYQAAIYTALGEYRSALAFNSVEAIDRAIGRLRESSRQSRVTFVPLTGGKAGQDLELNTLPGLLGHALEFVETDETFLPFLRLILGRTWVVRNLEDARSISNQLPLDARLVTLDGSVVYPSGLTILGSESEGIVQSGSLEQLEDHLATTLAEIEALEVRVREVEGEIIQRETGLSSLRDSMEQLGKEIQDAQGRRDHYLGEMELKRTALDEGAGNLKELQEDLARIADLLATLPQKIDQLASRRRDLEEALQVAMLQAEGDQSGFMIAQAQTRFEVSQRVYQGVESRLSDLSEQLNEIGADLSFKVGRLESIREEHTQTEAEMTEARQSLEAVESQIAEASEKVKPEEIALKESEEIRSKLEAEEFHSRSELQNAEREHSKAQILLAKRQEELVSLQRRIEDDFGLVTFDFEEGVMGQDPLPFEGLVEHLPRVESVNEETQAQMNRLRTQLRRLGAVNPGAKAEYDEVRNRVDFLTTQMADSHKAEEQIQNVIAELDLLMEREFRKTFDAVAIEFQGAFTHLFGGGSARLGLTDSDDLTQTGIDIEARLPGRREQGLAMLSGGERSLTACALIFALMKVSPTPFCVLDEVDAMLDDVNVTRFREMLQDLSKNTQFVVITHNRMTVQAAEVVYGVTMGSDSASQIISLKLEDAEKVLAGKG